MKLFHFHFHFTFTLKLFLFTFISLSLSFHFHFHFSTSHKMYIMFSDDLQTESNNSDYVSNLVTIGVHHLNFSLIITGHALFPPKKGPIITNNAHYIVLFFTPNKNAISRLGARIFPGQSGYFNDAYRQATLNKKGGYLLINTHPNDSQGNERYALQTNIFPHEWTVIYKNIAAQ